MTRERLWHVLTEEEQRAARERIQRIRQSQPQLRRLNPYWRRRQRPETATEREESR